MDHNDLFPESSGNKQKIREWARGIISDVKDAFGIRSPSTVMRDEVGKYLALGMAQGLAENDKFVVKQFSAMLEKLNYQRDFDLISEDEYYSRLEVLRDRYFAKGTQNWVKYTEKIYAYQQKLLEEEKKKIEEEKKSITSLYDDIADYAAERLDSVIAKQNKFAAELKDYGSLVNINEATINGITHKYYSLHDLNKDIEQIQLYSDLLERIKTRAQELGVDKDVQNGFMEELRNLDINAAVGVSDALMRARDENFSAYINAWGTKQKLSEKISAKQYEEEFNKGWEDAYSNMKRELEKAGYEIPNGFFTSGSISAQRFGQAFIDGLDEQMQKIRSKIEEFNASLAVNIDLGAQGGNTYTTNNTSYSINTGSGNDAVTQIRRYETLKRLSGVN